MTEYKVNTVGWWLSQLKEPLKSRALGIVMDTSHPCDNLDGALTSVLNCLIEGSIMWTYWQGVYVYYFGGLHIDSTNFKDGFDLAHECDPWREDKAIVDSPEKPEYWVDGEIRKYREHLLNGGIDLSDRKDSWQESQDMATYSAIRNHPKLGGKQPERAVVGYEEPKPIDTIEKKHELRIKNLEAYNKYQAERNQQIMDLNPHVDFCDSEGNLVRPSRMTALEARVKELEDQLFKLLGSKNG